MGGLERVVGGVPVASHGGGGYVILEGGSWEEGRAVGHAACVGVQAGPLVGG